MNKFLALLAGATLAGLTLAATPAAAGDGSVRLHFGLPLPYFIARPYPPDSGYYAYKYGSHRKYCHSYRARKTRHWRVACR